LEDLSTPERPAARPFRLSSVVFRPRGREVRAGASLKNQCEEEEWASGDRDVIAA
jgi:hypothetical protein